MREIKTEGVCIPAVFLYMASISIALMYTICRSEAVVWSAAMSTFCVGIYSIFYFLHGRKGLTLLAAGVMGGAAIAALNRVDAFSLADEGFMDFIFTASEIFDAKYAACAALIFSIFTGYVCFYFSVDLPRRPLLFTPALVPLILSSRTAGGLPLWMVYLMAGTYLLCCVTIARSVSSAGSNLGKTKMNLQRTLLGTGIAAVSVLIALLIPKSTVTPYGDFLDEVFSGSKGGYLSVSDRLTDFVTNSSVNRGANNPRQDLLFVVSSQDNIYIDRWSFDLYFGEEGWTSDKEYNKGYSHWESKASLASSSDLIVCLKYAARNGGLAQYAERLEKIPDYLPDTGTMVISIADGSTARVVLHPRGTLSVRAYPNDIQTYGTLRGELFFEYEAEVEPNISYALTYDRSKPNEYFAREFTFDEAYSMIVQARDEGFLAKDRASALLDEYNYALVYAGYEDSQVAEISFEIRELAQQITEGIESDYDKVLALEKWFGEAGFLYDLDYVPARTDANYFLFKSKRGICSDYATALTLMVRALGIPAKYTEGFVLSEDSRQEDGRYYVTADKAHAYTQVYIAGMGWVNFDGVKYVSKAEKNDSLGAAVYIAIGIALAALVLVIVFRRQIADVAFTAGLKLSKPEKRVRKAYRRINGEACEIAGVQKGTLTTGETAAVISNALGMKAQSESFRNMCDELFYNGTVSSDTSGLSGLCREIRRRRRRLKK